MCKLIRAVIAGPLFSLQERRGGGLQESGRYSRREVRGQLSPLWLPVPSRCVHSHLSHVAGCMLDVVINVCQCRDVGSPGAGKFDLSSRSFPGEVYDDSWWSSANGFPGCCDQSVDLCEHVKFNPLSQHTPSCHDIARGEPFLAHSDRGGALVVLPGSGRRVWKAAWRGPGRFTRVGPPGLEGTHRPFLANQPRRPAVCFWFSAKRDGDRPGPAPKHSFALPGNLETIYCCRLSALRETDCWHGASRAVRVGFPAPLGRRAGLARVFLPEWPENNSFAFPGLLSRETSKPYTAAG